MLLTEQFALGLLAALLGTQLLLRSEVFVKRLLSSSSTSYSLPPTLYLLRFTFSLALFGTFGIFAYWAWAHYRTWAAHPLLRHLLPPDQSIWYFVTYVGSRLVFPAMIALAAAVLAWYAMRALNRRFGGRFFEDEEPLLAAIAIFLVGYPGFLFYIPIMLLSGVVLSFGYQISGKGRAPLYFLWIPLALVVILISHLYLPPSFENFFKL